ncbi:MAG: hypothetical protein ACLUCZ_17055 [Thomasclavelia ramosa]
MDAVTEKFSVFDFFNLVIAGMVFWMLLGICHYSQLQILIKKFSLFISGSSLLLFATVVTFMGDAFIVGAAFQVISIWLFKKKIHWEKDIMQKCLTKDVLFDNEIRLNALRKRANDYLERPEGSAHFTPDKCEAFYAHCVYYLHVKELDKKTEKLRETQGLSKLLSCMFFTIPIISISIYVFQLLILRMVNLNLLAVIITYLVCFAFGYIFYCRYNITCKNRMRLVLSIYDANCQLK